MATTRRRPAATTKTPSRRSAKKSARTSAPKPPPKSARTSPAAALPEPLAPMYATTARELPPNDDGAWVFEPEYDGVRVIVHASPDDVRLVTRNGKDRAAQFPEIVAAARALARRRRRALVLDGEIVALAGSEPARVQAPAALVVFDLLADGGEPLLERPWHERRRRLERVVGRRPPAGLQLGASLQGRGSALLGEARRAGWEGVVAKRADAPYQAGARSRDWRRLAVARRREFVVGEPESVVQARATSDESEVSRERSAGPAARVTRHSSLVTQLQDIEASSDDGTLHLEDGTTLDVTSLARPYFPEAGLTKGDLMRYYVRIAPLLLPRLADRPLVLRRHPRGATGPSFFQQNAPPRVPRGVRVETIANDEGVRQRRFVGGNLATLLYLVQIGTISMDAWHERVGSFGVADYAVLDLDPGRAVPFTAVVEVAQALREVLQAEGLAASLKTSGKRGMHVYLPFPDGAAEDAALDLAKRLAEQVVARLPRLATVERSVRARPKRSVYVDYLQNIRAKPVAAPYCARATPWATVSTPLRWEELDESLDPRAFTIETVPGRVEEMGDVWML